MVYFLKYFVTRRDCEILWYVEGLIIGRPIIWSNTDSTISSTGSMKEHGILSAELLAEQ